MSDTIQINKKTLVGGALAGLTIGTLAYQQYWIKKYKQILQDEYQCFKLKHNLNINMTLDTSGIFYISGENKIILTMDNHSALYVNSSFDLDKYLSQKRKDEFSIITIIMYNNSDHTRLEFDSRAMKYIQTLKSPTLKNLSNDLNSKNDDDPGNDNPGNDNPDTDPIVVCVD